MIYLDNASTTMPDPEVVEAMLPYLTSAYGNPGTLYQLGRDAKLAIDKARKQVADFIGAKPEQIIFTSSGTEANNMVFHSLVDHLKKTNKNSIIVSSVEHDSVLKASEDMCIKHGFYKTVLGADKYGRVNPNDVSDIIMQRKERDQKLYGLVSVMYMNNETGSENDIYEIARICNENDVLFHTDCVQAAGCCDIDVNKIGCDFLSLSSHKIHGVKGCGALYAKDPSILKPTISGGIAQEFGLRGGTENVAAIVAFGKACEIMKPKIKDIDVHVTQLKHQFYETLTRLLKAWKYNDIVRVNGDIEQHGKTLNLQISGVDSETLVLFLDRRGICVSSGSACRSLEQEPSRVLLSMGLTPDEARQSIRISFSKMNTTNDIIDAVHEFADAIMLLLPGGPI